MSARDAFWFLAGALTAVAASLMVYPWLLMRHAAPAPPAADAVAAHISGNAQSGPAMDGAIAALEQRLAQGGGSDADWELLARSYDFVQRPEAAAPGPGHPPPLGAGQRGSKTRRASSFARDDAIDER